MITQWANMLSSFFIRKSLIAEDEEEIYEFCFEIFLAAALGWGSLFLLAAITGILKPFICYIFWFCIFRNAAGGYHADSHWKCYLISIVTFLLFLLVQYVVPESIYASCAFCFTIISILIFFLLAPVEHPNNPFSIQDWERHTRKTRLFMLCFSIIQILLLTLHMTAFSFNMSLGSLQAALSVAVAYYFNRERRQVA